MLTKLQADAKMALARHESSVAAFGKEASFTITDVRTVQEYINWLEASLQRANASLEYYERKFYLGTDRIEQLEAALREIIMLRSDTKRDLGYDATKAHEIARAVLGEKKDG
jgi:hypothetical protein